MEARLSSLERNLQQYMKINDQLLEENQALKTLVEDNNRRNTELSIKVKNLERAISGIQNNRKDAQIRPITAFPESAKGSDDGPRTDLIKNQTRNYGADQQFIINATKEPRKRIVPPTPDSAAENVAFHAYMSTNTASGLRQHHTLIFDTVKVNKGQGYHRDDGIFIIPSSGVYVFAWTLSVQNYDGWASVEIVVNGQIAGSTFADGGTGSFDSGTGLVVVEGNVGDHVYIRMHENGDNVVNSNGRARTSFSGLRLF
ncbi:heavy metal-binding protein HIP-like [Saccostrea cucullata]|uniref:heavy metal-binding protein HIP-like n=1 Tax=Saccostrea cuccullata TaxID=36930 RepID=UPI002ED179B7